ncbi:hypothetical protein QFZ60_001741 [Arthrobacter sp. B2I5]|uniref:hypothetical protein n=1 Tax=Arthrobacter sp. B2I5 TaxID=3042266 RepID=UPI0027858D03|nr:hypothetical protein [Arthrobacter sp. B2I5]MDQ0825568.1 hypothetical protein [Arthrobacter sp. B2I5]
MTKPDAIAPLLNEHTWSLLRQAHADFHSEASEVYDEVLIEVSDRIRSSRSIGKADIGALLFWKRLRADTRWVRDLMALADSEVRDTTGHAVSAVNDAALDIASAAAEGRKALSALPGFVRGDALASALLTAAAPDRMAVYDRRAQSGLEKLGLSLSAARGRYGRYMAIVNGLASEAERRGHPWSPRQVDLALFALGGQKRIS